MLCATVIVRSVLSIISKICLIATARLAENVVVEVASTGQVTLMSTASETPRVVVIVSELSLVILVPTESDFHRVHVHVPPIHVKGVPTMV